MKLFGYKPRWEHVCLVLPALALLAVIGGYLFGRMDGMTTTFLLIFPCVLFVFMGLFTALFSRSSPRQRIGYALLPFTMAVFMLLTSYTQWPMRLAFSVSRASFDTISLRVKAGEEIATPIQAGIFRVVKAELSPQGIVCLWTRPSAGGNTGFVQCPPDNIPFNLWSTTSLDNQWQFITED